ncbi:MAG: AtpZ/AtpI family protein [Nocardioides sp.]
MADDTDPQHSPEFSDPSGANPAPGQLTGRHLIGLGGVLVAGVVGGMVLGLLADRAAHTSPAFTLVGIFCGIALAGVAFWVRVRAALRG